jgi:hypothetical protein
MPARTSTTAASAPARDRRPDVACRFSRVGSHIAIHYPTGYTLDTTHLGALAQALRIARWHLDNAATIAAQEAARAAS